MSKSDRVTITYHEQSYEYYCYRDNELQYDYLETVKFKVRSKRKDFHYITERYWDRRWEARPEHNGYFGRLKGSILLPKLKKRCDKYYSQTFFSQYNSCPKWWNKLKHIKPNRRAWKRYVHTVIRYDMADGLAYPSYKKHVYYY